MPEVKLVTIAGSLATCRYEDDAISEEQLNEEGGISRVTLGSQAEADAFVRGANAVNGWAKFNAFSVDLLDRPRRFSRLLAAEPKPVKLVAFGGYHANQAYEDDASLPEMLRESNEGVTVHGFDTTEEAAAFLKGVEIADGWDHFMVATEEEFQATLARNRAVLEEEGLDI